MSKKGEKNEHKYLLKQWRRAKTNKKNLKKKNKHRNKSITIEKSENSRKKETCQKMEMWI